MNDEERIGSSIASIGGLDSDGIDDLVVGAYGEGDVHLFAFRPQYRGWSQSTFQLIFRAMLFGDS